VFVATQWHIEGLTHERGNVVDEKWFEKCQLRRKIKGSQMNAEINVATMLAN